ncbi:unnamed protein product [Rotaria sp. Silwood2]|nr:unnamed protein product [Rotaria sp. Silwood2]
MAFLNVLVTHEQNKLTTSLYRKPAHTGLYMLWDSNQNRRNGLLCFHLLQLISLSSLLFLFNLTTTTIHNLFNHLNAPSPSRHNTPATYPYNIIQH